MHSAKTGLHQVISMQWYLSPHGLCFLELAISSTHRFPWRLLSIHLCNGWLFNRGVPVSSVSKKESFRSFQTLRRCRQSYWIFNTLLFWMVKLNQVKGIDSESETALLLECKQNLWYTYKYINKQTWVDNLRIVISSTWHDKICSH